MILTRLKKDKKFRLSVTTSASLILNIVYALGNFVLGIQNRSYWFVTLGAYFMVLSIMRSVCMSAVYSSNKKVKYIGRLVGLLLIALCITLIGSVVLSDRFDVIQPVHEIVMITIAAFTTAKTTLAVINTVKASKTHNPVIIALRNISCADAAASILSMQRSMLMSFGEIQAESTYKLMNLFTGIGVCFVIFTIGISSFRKRYY